MSHSCVPVGLFTKKTIYKKQYLDPSILSQSRPDSFESKVSWSPHVPLPSLQAQFFLNTYKMP